MQCRCSSLFVGFRAFVVSIATNRLDVLLWCDLLHSCVIYFITIFSFLPSFPSTLSWFFAVYCGLHWNAVTMKWCVFSQSSVRLSVLCDADLSVFFKFIFATTVPLQLVRELLKVTEQDGAGWRCVYMSWFARVACFVCVCSTSLCVCVYLEVGVL